jgi:bifunctional DNA-binding transcriptional regulator/antitoxin component of YhaV-PrlF toxin-antitoxin module
LYLVANEVRLIPGVDEGGICVTVTTRLGERGLLRLPASVRDEAGLEKGDELVVMTAGRGRILLTTRSAIQDEVWAGAPKMDQATNMRAERGGDEDAVAAKQHRSRARGSATREDEAERIGTALLDKFGL